MGWEYVGYTALIGVLIPVIAMIIGLAIALFAINRNYKIRRLEHDLRLKALEKGYDIPQLPERGRSKPVYPFAWPFIFIGFGLALISIYLFADGDETAIGFGLISLFLGLALFASRFYGVKKDEMSATERAAANSWRAPAMPDAPSAPLPPRPSAPSAPTTPPASEEKESGPEEKES